MLPEGLELVDSPGNNSLDYLHLFVTESNDLHYAMSTMLPWLKKDGGLWISWPKKTSRLQTDVDKWQVLEAGRAVGLVDVKVAAIDETWSGQKFMYRRQDR